VAGSEPRGENRIRAEALKNEDASQSRHGAPGAQPSAWVESSMAASM